MATKFILTCAGFLMLAIAYNLCVSAAQAQAKHVGPSQGPTGRYMIVETQRGPYLLDTATGRNWNYCTADAGGTHWCEILTYVPGGPNKE